MKIEDWPLSKIRPYPNNPRVLRNAAGKVAESIKAFGWRQPIVVDADGVIIVGHSRLEAAKLLKLKTAPVHIAKELTPDQVRALRVADNKTAEFAVWDEAKLADELAEILAGIGDISVTGFTQSEMEALEMRAMAELARLEPAAPEQREETPEVQGEEEVEPAGAPEPGADEQAAPETQQEQPAGADMVPFNVLLTVDARQIVYDAIAAAKQRHGLETTADAIVVIARSFTNA